MLSKDFDNLMVYYQQMHTDDAKPLHPLSVSFGIVKQVYEHVTKMDGQEMPDFSDRSGSDMVYDTDLIPLFARLALHYKRQFGERVADIDELALQLLFEALAEYYLIGEGQHEKNARNLWTIFDSLAETYGGKSDFDLDDDETETLFDALKNDRPINQMFEGQSVQNMQDLVKME